MTYGYYVTTAYRDRPVERRVWRVGKHYDIHVYEGNRPVATFLTSEDAAAAVQAFNGIGNL